MAERLGRPCTCGCGRTAQRERAYAWLCDPAVPAELKREARAKGGRKVVLDAPDPRFATADGRREFREAIAGAVVRGELAPPLAAIALRACAQAEERPAKGEKPPTKPVLVEPWRQGRPA
jgi:hypothetical protein